MKTKVQLLKTFIRSNYGCEAWKLADAKKLEASQYKYMKHILRIR